MNELFFEIALFLKTYSKSAKKCLSYYAMKVRSFIHQLESQLRKNSTFFKKESTKKDKQKERKRTYFKKQKKTNTLTKNKNKYSN